VKSGYNALVIDEVHKYENWSRELKQIYDIHSELKVILTGSSILDIQKGEVDLSRRIVIYEMYGLSFREYLKMFHNINAETYSLEDILNHKVSLKELAHPLPYFKQYLKEGYYPFAIEGSFSLKMQQVITQTIESDIAQFADLKATTARKLKKLLSVISTLAPYKPNVSTLSTVVGVSKNNINDYLIYMEKAGLLGQLRDDTGGIRGIGKVEKVFIDNPSLMHVLANGVPNEGNCRETFFYNQMKVRNDVIASKESDFTISNYTFEIGGKKKGKKQIEDIPNGYIVRDDIEYGNDIIIPLWHFGLNY
jgi:predicted AAA+ superfamily ATPase